MNIKKQNEVKKEVWIGLVNIKPKPGNTLFDKDVIGAYVNVLAQATNINEYSNEVVKMLNNYNVKLINIEDAEPLSIRRSNFNVDDNLIKLSLEVEQTGKPRFGQFHFFG